MVVPVKSGEQARERERRQLRGGRTLLRGVARAELGRVRVSRPTVLEWDKRLREEGMAAMKRRPRGRRSWLGASQGQELVQLLRRGTGHRAMGHDRGTDGCTRTGTTDRVDERDSDSVPDHCRGGAGEYLLQCR